MPANAATMTKLSESPYEFSATINTYTKNVAILKYNVSLSLDPYALQGAFLDTEA